MKSRSLLARGVAIVGIALFLVNLRPDASLASPSCVEYVSWNWLGRLEQVTIDGEIQTAEVVHPDGEVMLILNARPWPPTAPYCVDAVWYCEGANPPCFEGRYCETQ